MDINKFTFYFGSHDSGIVESHEKSSGAKAIVYNPTYKTTRANGGGIKHDVAIIKLTTPVQYNNYIRPVCMANALQTAPKDPSSCVAAGWGRTYSNTYAYSNKS